MKFNCWTLVGRRVRRARAASSSLALSLIGALKQAAVRGGPVVLDSPLGRLDLEHRENVLKTWIPALGGQAVLLVQSGELTREAAQSVLGPPCGPRISDCAPVQRPRDRSY